MKNWSSRKSLIPSFAVANQILSTCKYTNPICRVISKILNPLGVEIAFCRYQSKIEFYSGIHDRRNWDRYLVEGEDVKLNSVQARKMQGFPKDWFLSNSEAKSMKLLGNSVPISLFLIAPNNPSIIE